MEPKLLWSQPLSDASDVTIINKPCKISIFLLAPPSAIHNGGSRSQGFAWYSLPNKKGADTLLCVVQPATLMALPDGVPEELHVACAGRLGLMNVRSQTVMFGGQAMSASRFEAVCGKGDAKKWKSSLWAASQEGIPEQVRSSRESLLSALTHSLRAESQL